MNWAVIGTFAEITAAVAVVVTLLFVALDIRQNSKSLSISVGVYDVGILAAIFESNQIRVLRRSRRGRARCLDNTKVAVTVEQFDTHAPKTQNLLFTAIVMTVSEHLEARFLWS